MPSVSTNLHFEQVEQLLFRLQERFAAFSPDCQDALCAELNRFSETIKQILPEDAPPSPAARQVPPRESEYQMGMVLRRANAGVFVRDLVNKTVIWSPELYDLLAIDPSVPSQSETFMHMIHPEDYPRAVADTQAAIKQGGTYYQEFRVVRPDGKTLWLSSIGYVEHDAEGRPITLTGINQDITERKTAELALEAAHAEVLRERNRLLAVMEALPIGVAICDQQGRVIQANRGYEEVWGGPRPETNSVDAYWMYKAWWAENGQPLPPDQWAAAQAVREGKTVVNQYLEIERFDGSHRFVLNSAAPVQGADGAVTGCAVAIRDITTLIQTQKELNTSERLRREVEERFRVALSSLPITVVMLDRELRYTWVYSPRFGLTVERMLGRRITDVFGPDIIEVQYLEKLQSALETGQGFQHEMKIHADGGLAYFLMTVEPFRDAAGTITGLISASLDVTKQRSLEIEHRDAMNQIQTQRQVVENREKERQDIAREIHDGPIQTLVSMMFDLQLTREEVKHQAFQEALDQINTRLKEAVRELRGVVNNLRPPALLRFGLGKSLQIYAVDFQEKHPELTLAVVFDLPDDRIYFSEETTLSLYRLCQEGLNNIVRHAHASKAEIRFTQIGEAILIEIQDDGTGFNVPEDLAHKAEQGHYGLAGMKERVQALGGELEIQSSPGKGTLIKAAIPIE